MRQSSYARQSAMPEAAAAAPAPAPAFASSRRSAMPKPASASSLGSDFPDRVLLDTVAHIGHCDNETTAETETSACKPIKVSFVVVDPPGVSRCVVHCPDLTAGDLSAPPLVTGVDGAFLLIRVFLPERGSRRMFTDVFVYRAGTTPSLYLLPRPYPIHLRFDHVGVLSCGDGHCIVVIPERRFDDSGRMSYDLQVLSTKTQSWSTKVARVASGLERHYGGLVQHKPTKVFSIGGGRLAWVDLREGILMCDVLGKDPEMRLIQLPPLMPNNKVRFGVGLDGARPDLRPIRDVTCRNGLIRFIEMEYPKLNDSHTTKFQWVATISKRMIDSGKWVKCCTVNSADFLPADSCFPYLFPEIWNYKENELNNVVCTAPMLDVYHDSVVYMMSKLDARDLNGWVLAVDTENKKLKKAVPFSAEKFYIDHDYMQCDFSKYLSKAPGTHLAKSLEKCTNRKKIELLETYLLAALDQLKDIEIHMESLKQRHSGSMSLLYSDSASSLEANIRKAAEYGLDDGRGKYPTHPVDECLRVMRDIRLHISAPIDATKSKIRVAHGALYNLMQTLPSNVLDEEYVEPSLL